MRTNENIFKFDGDFINSKGEFYVPMWAEEAYKNGTLFYKDTPNSPSELFLHTHSGDIHINLNDCVMCDKDGTISVA